MPSLRRGLPPDPAGFARELAEAEYGWQLAHEARMVSAGWALAYVFFIFWYWPKAKPTDADGRPL